MSLNNGTFQFSTSKSNFQIFPLNEEIKTFFPLRFRPFEAFDIESLVWRSSISGFGCFCISPMGQVSCSWRASLCQFELNMMSQSLFFLDLCWMKANTYYIIPLCCTLLSFEWNFQFCVLVRVSVATPTVMLFLVLQVVSDIYSWDAHEYVAT